MAKIQVIGVTRFSYACYKGFRKEHGTPQQRLDFLFNPERIEERFALFEHVTLPAIKAQTDPNFILVIVTSRDIPQHYLERLAVLVEGIPQIALVPQAPLLMSKGVRKAIKPFIDETADVIAHFRLDDDDGVAIDFVASLRATFEECRANFETHKMAAVDYAHGVVIASNHNPLLAKALTRNLWTPALAIYLLPTNKKTIVHYHHYRLYDIMPVKRFDDQAMFVRGLNDYNDSYLAQNMTGLKPVTPSIRDTLQSRFNINVAELEKALTFAHST